MAQSLNCPRCNTNIVPTDHFCSQCGIEIASFSKAITKSEIALVTMVTVLLPPLGLIWAFKYLRRSDQTYRKFAFAIIILTVISILVTLWASWGIVTVFRSAFGIDEQLNAIGL